jgi:hypothetical protein
MYLQYCEDVKDKDTKNTGTCTTKKFRKNVLFLQMAKNFKKGIFNFSEPSSGYRVQHQVSK